jgi:hypothetical protein
MRAQQLVAVVPGSAGGAAAAAASAPRAGSPGGRSARAAAQRVTAAAWLGGGARGDLATGHGNGDVLVWALPKPPAAADGQPGDADAGGGGAEPPLQCRLLSRLRVVAAPGAAAAVRSVEYLVEGKKEGLLVFGGQEADRPDALALLPLPLPTEVRARVAVSEGGRRAPGQALFRLIVRRRQI